MPGRVHMSVEFCTALRETDWCDRVTSEEPDGTAFLVTADYCVDDAVSVVVEQKEERMHPRDTRN